MKEYTSVIAAVSTPPGKGGVAIIRISGDGAIDIAGKIFYPKNKKPLSDMESRVQTYGNVISDGEEIDDGMATIFRAPASYTGEDTVEISCHGGVLVTSEVLEAIFKAGAIPAAPGEFTRRAFINGKLTLTEAEAIGSLLEAKSHEQIKLSSSKARELLTNSIDKIREAMVDVLSSIYARIDYPDEDLGDFTDEETVARLTAIRTAMQTLKSTYKTGKAINEGIKTVICGKPNVGKSSLYNLLLGTDAAIVTDIAGTTRDVLTDTVTLGKTLLNLSDTAGIRGTDGIDPVEKIGIDRSYGKIEESELIISVFDASSICEEDGQIISKLNSLSTVKIAVLNKCDLGEDFSEDVFSSFDAVIKTSLKESGIDAIEKISAEVNRLFTNEKISPSQDAIISSARQNAQLSLALELIDSAIDAYNLGISADAASSDIERALGQIAELDGKAVSEAVVADIFSKFCVGK